jgi:hypothetical protein
MSKGSNPRPFSVTEEEYKSRWDAIFGRDLEKKEMDEAIEQKAKERQEPNE